MGVLVFLLSLLPLAGGYHMNLMKAESPGPSVGKLVPKVQQTAKILYTIYIGMTLFQIILLLIGRIPLFDTLCISFGTAGTGGFGIVNDSMGYSVSSSGKFLVVEQETVISNNTDNRNRFMLCFLSISPTIIFSS